jgi:predicted regulator of Ras-like GTPase activity (Roadblock/LC7/MglB family)
LSLDMGFTKSQTLEVILSELRETGEIIASLIFTQDGLVISSDIQPVHDDGKTAAFLGMMTKSTQKAIRQLGHDPLEYILLKINEGYIIIMNAGSSALLAVFIKQNVKIALSEMNKASKKIEEFV